MIRLLMLAGANPYIANAAGQFPFQMLNLPQEEARRVVDNISCEGLNNFDECYHEYPINDVIDEYQQLLAHQEYQQRCIGPR
jgi:hypothetical protein